MGMLRGHVTDQLGGLMVGIKVTISDPSGMTKTTATTTDGVYVFDHLAPGRYRLQAAAKGFAPYENSEIDIARAETKSLDIKLSVTIEEQQVTVSTERAINVGQDTSASGIVLRGADLDILPDDPDELAAALQALAGPSVGPNGGDVYVDGFLGGRLPPKNSIREVRINQNPWSAEYDSTGGGRVEITTKPGTDKLHGRGFLNFNDESLNSRNPFAPNRAPFQSRLYGGSLSNTIVKQKVSFFLDFERREIDDNAVINAIVLSPALVVIPFGQVVVTPQRLINLSGRFDFQISPTNTLVARYNYTRSSLQNAGVGEFSLVTRSLDTANDEHTLQLTDTAVLNAKVLNEVRFQYIHRMRTQQSNNAAASINVVGAFNGGGSQVGMARYKEDRWEIQNYSSWVVASHSLKAGGRLRGVSVRDIAPTNFGGTFTFAGGQAVKLDDNNQVVRVNGQPVFESIASIERYRRTLLFQRNGFPSNINGLSPSDLGYGPTQFSIAGGNSEARVNQLDLAIFLQDNWVLRPNLAVSLGLRYETQSNIHNNAAFAPRAAVVWLPGNTGKGQPKTSIRAGFGIYYERFAESFTLRAHRFNGINQQQFVISDPAILSLFPVVPPLETIQAFGAPQTLRRIEPNLQAPYTMQYTIGLERQLPFKTSFSLALVNTRSLHQIRSRNINAPLPGTFVLGVPGNGVRPFGNLENIYEYESNGRFNQRLLRVYTNTRFHKDSTFFVEYVLNTAKSDGEGLGSFPASSYDLRAEYGRSLFDFRQRLIMGGSLITKWKINLSPFIIWRAGIPFNITTGRDSNGDSLYTDRPAFAMDLNKPGVIVTSFGAFDPNPQPGQALVPRNFGNGPSYFTVDLRASRTFGLGSLPHAAPKSGQPQNGAGVGKPPGNRQSTTEKRYYLTLALQVQNLLNHTNPSLYIGDLSSPFFGRANATAGFYGFGTGYFAGNRRLTAQMSLRF